MAIKIDRQNGQNYAENLANSALSFNGGTWTVASGTGTSTISPSTYFEGVSSLRLQNNVPASDLTVTNTNHTTVIDLDGNYQISLHLRKDVALEQRQLDVLVYQNAVLLDTQSCLVGSTDADLDDNDEWVRYQLGSGYALNKLDEITFQFVLKGTATAEPTTIMFIDALMINPAERGNAIVPYYTKPNDTTSVQNFGVYNYDDATTSVTPISLTEDDWTDVTNDGAGANTFIGGGFSGITPYDTSTNLFDWSDLSLYDTIDIRFDTLITTTSANEFVSARMLLSVGSLDIPLTFISTQFKSAGTYPLVSSVKVVLYTDAVKNSGAKFQVFTDGASSELEVNGWSMQVNKRLV